MTELKIIPTTDSLFLQLPGQHQPQPTNIELDLTTGSLRAAADVLIGSTSIAVYQGLERRYPIPRITRDAADSLLAAIAADAQSMLDDSREEVKDGNRVIVLGERGKAAEESIRAAIEALSEPELNNPITLDDLGDVDVADMTKGRITAATADAQIYALAKGYAKGLIEVFNTPDSVVEAESLVNLLADGFKAHRDELIDMELAALA